MKFVVLALAFVSFSPAHALRVEGPRFVKQLDGGIAYCANPDHLGRSAYYPTALDLTTVGDQIRLQAPVAFVTCAELEKDRFGWAPRNPHDPVQARDLEGRIILNVVENQEFVLLSNQTRLVGVQEIKNFPGQTADFLVSLDKVITSEQKTILDGGYKVDTRFTFFTRGNVHVIDAGGNRSNIGQRSGGAYTVMFSMQKNRDSGLLEVSGVKFGY